MVSLIQKRYQAGDKNWHKLFNRLPFITSFTPEFLILHKLGILTTMIRQLKLNKYNIETLNSEEYYDNVVWHRIPSRTTVTLHV